MLASLPSGSKHLKYGLGGIKDYCCTVSGLKEMRDKSWDCWEAYMLSVRHGIYGGHWHVEMGMAFACQSQMDLEL